MSAEWYCRKFGLKIPPLIGLEIEDEITGDWSFLLMDYGFAWGQIYTWAGHFSSATQLAILLKALSESRQLPYYTAENMIVNNVPQVFADVYGLPSSGLYYKKGYKPIVRLPSTRAYPHESKRKVHWLGMGESGSNTRG